jgi:uncharacterized membrane protein
MGTYHRHGVESTAAVFRHPIHPMLIPFPIASLIGALVTDIAFRATSNVFWADVSFWLLLAGVVTGAVAAIPGMIDFSTIDRVRSLTSAWVHAGGNVVALTLAIINLSLRWSDPVAGAQGWGLALSLVTVALLGVTGWLGGELSYRHRIGAINDESGVADNHSVEVARAEKRRVANETR